MQKILLILLLFLNPLPLLAEEPAGEQAITQEALDKTNEVMHKIFEEILAAKAKYKELASFDETALSKNQHGLYLINYEIEIPSAGGKTSLYAFALTAETLRDKTYKSKMGYFNYPMPVLGLQFSGYVIKHPLRRQFDIRPLFDKYAEEMVDYQQQFIPLRLVILPTKDAYHVGEPIEFKVILANVSKQNVLVKSLGQDTLFFTLNNEFWGTDTTTPQVKEPTTRYEKMMERHKQLTARIEARMNARKGRGIKTERGLKTKVGVQTILRSEEALTLDFIGDGYKRPQDIEIRAIYQLNIKGVKPTTKINLKIIPPTLGERDSAQ